MRTRPLPHPVLMSCACGSAFLLNLERGTGGWGHRPTHPGTRRKPDYFEQLPTTAEVVLVAAAEDVQVPPLTAQAELLKVSTRLPPSRVTATMMTTAMSATMMPYSTAVAPVSSRRARDAMVRKVANILK